MPFNREQFEDLIRESLERFDRRMVSDAAVNLLLGTAAQESKFGTYLRQIGGGPALGVFQMEPATCDWLIKTYIKRYPYLGSKVSPMLVWDLKFAIIMARLRYWIVPQDLPKADDLIGLANYYKSHYNSPQGKATIEQFIENYKLYVGGNHASET